MRANNKYRTSMVHNLSWMRPDAVHSLLRGLSNQSLDTLCQALSLPYDGSRAIKIQAIAIRAAHLRGDRVNRCKARTFKHKLQAYAYA